ncbi:MAG: hypothetical protein ACO1G9_15630 [Bacteroidota bacterium]
MNSGTVSRTTFKSTFILAVAVLFSCWGLFWLDHETKEIGDLFKWGNLAALLVYFLPTFLLSYIIYQFFIRKFNNTKSLVLSLVVGIPVGFLLIILAFYFHNH